mgnify:CR=1 FL=1
MSRHSKWDDELIEKLKELYNEKKYSTKQIGDMLGFSKNAIVGKIHRLELNKVVKEDNSNIDNYQSSIKEGQYRLEDIDDTMCVWPYGEEVITFCGKNVIPGKHYCKEHFEKAYLRFTKKSIKKE